MENKKENKTSIFIYVLCFLFLLVLGFQLYVIPNVGLTSKEKAIAEEELNKTNAEIEKIKMEIVANTVEKKNEKIIKDNIDVDKELVNTTKIINATMDTVYNKQKNDLSKEIDHEFTGLLSDISKPVINQTGEEQTYFDKLEELVIGYGSYQIDNNLVDTVVAVKYKSPPVVKKRTGGKEEDKGEEIFLTGFDTYRLLSDLKIKEIKLDSYLNVPQTGETK